MRSFPKLHKIVYAHTTEGVAARYQQSYKDYQVNMWLRENCRGNYYHHPGWTDEKFIEFEDERDAAWFTLRWA